MTTRQLIPRKRRAIRRQNMSEELAAALLMIRLEDGSWLIDDEDLREKGTPKQIRKYVECDHTRRVAEGGTNDPQNLWFRRIPDHDEKTRTIDIPEIAKGKRYGKKHEEFRRRLLAKQEGEPMPKPTRSKKGHAKLRSRNTLTKQARDAAKAWKETHNG